MHHYPIANRIILLILLTTTLAPFAIALTGLYNQTMTWNILANQSHSITYGGSCSASAFYFNEVDANFDPDADGNAAKIAPSARTRLAETNAYHDYNFVGITTPSSTYLDFYTIDFSQPPTNYNLAVEIEHPFYSVIQAEDGAALPVDAGGAFYPGQKAVFKVTENPSKIKQLTFNFAGSSIVGTNCDSTGSGVDSDLKFYLYDWNNLVYRRIGFYIGTGATISDDNSTISKTIAIDYNIPRFIGTDTNVTFLAQSVIGSADPKSCIFVDYIAMGVTYFTDNNVFCQSSLLAPMTLRNTGNTDINVDGNFTSAFAGNDVNLVLKVWQGTGSGCGTNGMGGWEKDCSITNNQQDLGMTTCRQYNQSNAVTSARLITNLGVGDTNQLCFSGDFNTYAPGGSHTNYFNTFDTNST